MIWSSSASDFLEKFSSFQPSPAQASPVDMKKILVFWLVLVALQVPIACDPDDCGDLTPRYSTITSMSATIGMQENATLTFDNLPDTLAAESTVVSVRVDTVIYFSTIHPTYGSWGAAFACSPVPPQPTQRISGIEIIASRSLVVGGADYPSGEDLSSLFLVVNYSCGSTTQCGISDFIRDQNERSFIFGAEGEYLLLQLQPTLDTTFRGSLRILLTLEDGTSFSMNTRELIMRRREQFE